jgi:hypothetical protein
MLATFTPSGLSLATDLAVTEGGTGASDAATARTNLGISATNTPFTPTGNIAASNVQAALVELDSEKQPASANLDEYAAVNPTAAGLALLDDADAAAQRATLGLVIGTNVQAYDADTAKTDVEQTWTAQQTPKNGTLTDGANIDWDGDTHGQSVKVTLAGNRTMNAPTNINEYASYVLRITQDGTGSRTLGWNTAYKFAGGTLPTLTTTANAVDVLTFVAGPSNTLYCIGKALDVRNP